MFCFRILDVLWLMVLAACAVVCADEPGPTLKELVQKESEGRAARSYLAGHTEFQPNKTKTRNLLTISWFISKYGNSVWLYHITDDGSFLNGRDVYDWALQASSQTILPPNDLKRLKVLLSALPQSNAEPPIERTVLVSFQSGDKWRTETYDAAALPEAFEKVLLIVGERSETKDRHKKKAAIKDLP
jgi:hypothetical protein